MSCNCEQKKCTCNKHCKTYAKDICYTGPDLECIDIFPKEKNVENYLIKIDEIICLLLGQQLDYGILTLNTNGFLINTFTVLGAVDTTFNVDFDNVGTGAESYKGLNTLINVNEFRTINKTGDLITINETTDEIIISIDEDELNNFVEDNQKTYTLGNVGAGAEVYNENPIVAGDNTQYNLKSLKSSGAGAGVSIVEDIDIISDPNEINFKFKNLQSDNIMIEEQLDGSIKLTAPEELFFEYLTAFYVNSNYVPTITSPADGSIIRPFPSFEEARTKFIGTGDIVNPEFAGAVIILQTSSTAVNNPTINGLTIQFENTSLVYVGSETIAAGSEFAGTDAYMFDTEILYPLVPKNIPRNDLTQDIKVYLTGVGTIIRNNGIGLVRGLASDRNGLSIITDKVCNIYVGKKETDVITLHERTEYPPSIEDGDVTDIANVPLENFYGEPYKYTLQLPPTIPLMYSKYESGEPFNRGVECMGLVRFVTVANTAVQVVGGLTHKLLTGHDFEFLVYSKLISTVSGTKLIDFPNAYEPHPDRNFIELDDADIYCEKAIKMNDSSGFTTTGIDNFFKSKNDGVFAKGRMEIATNMYINKFINLSDVSNTISMFSLSNNSIGSNINVAQGRYFLDTNEPVFSFTMPNTFVKAFSDLSTSPVDVIGVTQGTMSSFFGVPVISGIVSYANDAAAQAAGLIFNSLYFNTTNNTLDIL